MFHKLEYLSIQLTNVLDKNCDCGLSPKYFVFDEPHCLASQPEWIILSGFIIGTDISNCSVIMNHLQVWAEAGSELIVEGITLAAIKHCSPLPLSLSLSPSFPPSLPASLPLSLSLSPSLYSICMSYHKII